MAIAATALGGEAPGAEPVGFTPPQRIGPEQVGVLAAASADLDGDGNDELLSAASKHCEVPHLRIHKWTGTEFESHDLLGRNAIERRRNRFGFALAAADLDGDEDLDIVVADSDFQNRGGAIYWYENPGNGSLSGWPEHLVSRWDGADKAPEHHHKVAHVEDVAIADLDDDGLPDIVMRDMLHGTWIFFQDRDADGRPVWVSAQVFLAHEAREGLVVADLDGDEIPDLLLNGFWYQTPRSSARNPAGYRRHEIDRRWRQSPSGAADHRFYATKLAVSDFNGDGLNDVLIANAEELSPGPADEDKPDGVLLYLADPNAAPRQWMPPVTLLSRGNSLHCLAVGDVDRDGDVDVLTGVSTVGRPTTDPQVVLLLNPGGVHAADPARWHRQSVADVPIYVGDMFDADGDGDLDLVAPANWKDGPIRFFVNLTVP